MGESTSKSWKACIATHSPSYWQTSCLNNYWQHGASDNANSPQAYGTCLVANHFCADGGPFWCEIWGKTKSLIPHWYYYWSLWNLHWLGRNDVLWGIPHANLHPKNVALLPTCNTTETTTCTTSTWAHQIWCHSSNSPSWHFFPTITCANQAGAENHQHTVVLFLHHGPHHDGGSQLNCSMPDQQDGRCPLGMTLRLGLCCNTPQCHHLLSCKQHSPHHTFGFLLSVQMWRKE